MIPTDFSPPARLNERVYRAMSALLISLMMVCAVVTAMQLIARGFGTWNPSYLPVVVFLFSLERFYLHPTFNRLSYLDRRWLWTHGAHWLAVAIILKLVVTLSHGWHALTAEIPLWQEDFLPSFFTIEYLGIFAICLITWNISGRYAELFDEMGLDQALQNRDYGVASSDHKRPARERLQGLVFSLGALLVVLTALSRIDIRAVFLQQPGDHIANLSLLDGGGFSTLLYFMLGFALLSLAKFINLHTRWSLLGIPVSRNIANRWAGYSLIFLVALAASVSLLPTHYSLGLLSLLHNFLSFIVYILSAISGFLWLLLMYPLAALLSLFGGALPSVPPAPPSKLEPPTFIEPQSITPNPGWELLKTFLFWGFFIVVVGFALRQYLLQHQEILEALRKMRLAQWLIRLGDWIATLFRSINYQLATLIDEGLDRLRSSDGQTLPARAGRFLSLRRLNPRQQIHFFYHALIRRGNENRLPRKLSQTPDEYAVTLEQALPEVMPEIEVMTEAFIEARYTQQNIGEEDVGLVKSQWKRIRNAFRSRRAQNH